ncbi:MAG: DUF1893 domain-containing protein [Christensenellaceae bacterium]|jgi:hypothetical protein
MTDKLTKAKELLENFDWTCVLVKGYSTSTSALHGIRPIMEWLKENAAALNGASIADKVVGKAAALLMAYGKAAEVYAGVISTPAKEVLQKNNIALEYGTEVPLIQNREGTGNCPMEAACLHTDSPEEAYAILSEKLNGPL